MNAFYLQNCSNENQRVIDYFAVIGLSPATQKPRSQQAQSRRRPRIRSGEPSQKDKDDGGGAVGGDGADEAGQLEDEDDEQQLMFPTLLDTDVQHAPLDPITDVAVINQSVA